MARTVINLPHTTWSRESMSLCNLDKLQYAYSNTQRSIYKYYQLSWDFVCIFWSLYCNVW